MSSGFLRRLLRGRVIMVRFNPPARHDAAHLCFLAECHDIGLQAAKTGMLASTEIIDCRSPQSSVGPSSPSASSYALFGRSVDSA